MQKDTIWDGINPEYKWAAKDKNGDVYMYTDEPKINKLHSIWFKPFGYSKTFKMRGQHASLVSVKWHHSLISRPETENQIFKVGQKVKLADKGTWYLSLCNTPSDTDSLLVYNSRLNLDACVGTIKSACSGNVYNRYSVDFGQYGNIVGNASWFVAAEEEPKEECDKTVFNEQTFLEFIDAQTPDNEVDLTHTLRTFKKFLENRKLDPAEAHAIELLESKGYKVVK